METGQTELGVGKTVKVRHFGHETKGRADRQGTFCIFVGMLHGISVE